MNNSRLQLIKYTCNYRKYIPLAPTIKLSYHYYSQRYCYQHYSSNDYNRNIYNRNLNYNFFKYTIVLFFCTTS